MFNQVAIGKIGHWALGINCPPTPLHWCQLKPKPFSNLVSSLWLEMQIKSGSAASLEAEALIGIPSLRLGTRKSLKAAYRLAFSLS
ncbi:hypothetical protein [Nostoc sp.]|uniref:hypothetical protein n=1 Tax=Nostoc sp. TaxID=1180 RepID=UPI002FFAF383